MKKFLILFLLLFLVGNVFAADRYWVGGAGTWDTSTTHWASCSGCSGGETVPTSSDNVFFDANSGTGTVNFSGPFYCNANDLNLVGSLVSFGFSGGSSAAAGCYDYDSFTSYSNWARVYGNLDTGGKTISGIMMSGTTGIKTINNTASISTIYFNGGATFKLLNNLTTTSFIVSNGDTNFDANDKNVIISSSGYIDINLTNKNIVFYNLIYTPATMSNFFIKGDFNVSNRLIIGGTSEATRVLVRGNKNNLTKTRSTINSHINDFNYVSFESINGGGDANWDLRSLVGGAGDYGNNNGITFLSGINLYYVSGANNGTWTDSTKWKTSSGGSTIGRIPLAQDKAIIDINSFSGTRELSVDTSFLSDINFSTSVDVNVNFTKGTNYLMNNIDFYDTTNFYSSTISESSLYLYLFSNSNSTIKTNTKKFFGALYLYSDYNYTLMSDINISIINLRRGNFNSNSKNMYFYSFYTSPPVGTVNISNSLLNINSYGTSSNLYFNTMSSTNLISTNSTIIINKTAAANRGSTIGCADSNFFLNILQNKNTTSTDNIIYGYLNINNLIIDTNVTQKFYNGNYITINNITADGNIDANVKLISSQNNYPATLIKGGSGLAVLNYAYIKDLNVSPLNKWYAINSYDVNNNTGWTFGSPPRPTTSVSGNSTNWTNTDQNIILTCTPVSPAVCVSTSYSINSGAWQTYDYNILITTDGNNYIDYYSLDDYGVQEITKRVYVAVDKTKATTSWNLDSNYWYNTSKSVSLSCNDSVSGCLLTKYRYALLPSGAFTSWQTYTNSIVFDTEGKYRIDFNSSDNATNQGDLNTQFLFIDLTKPSISSDANSTWQLSGDSNIHLTCTDSLSDKNTIYYRVDDDNSSGINYGNWILYDQNVLITGDGNFAINYFCRNNAMLDSNTSVTPVDVNYILVEKNNPPTPITLMPNTGSFVTTVNIICGAPSWIRDYNYSIDFNTLLLDWNNIYNGSDTSYSLDVNNFPTDSNLFFRCKITDGDKNSSYYTTSTSILVNEDTGFDSISNATPIFPTTIFSASAPFSVTANDSSGVKYCTFEIYKNSIKVGDFNGTDGNAGIWNYTYNNISNADILFSYVYCVDNTNKISAKISSSTYSANITPPPSGGGGGGGTVEVKNVFQVIYDKPSATLYYGKNRIATIKISVKNITDKPIEVVPSTVDAIEPYFLDDLSVKNIIEPNLTKDIEFKFLVNDDSQKLEGKLKLTSGSQKFEIPITMIFDEQRDMLSQLRGFLNFGVDLTIIIIPLWIFIVGILFVIMTLVKNTLQKNIIFLLLVMVIFIIFSFEILQFFGVSL